MNLGDMSTYEKIYGYKNLGYQHLHKAQRGTEETERDVEE